MFNQERYLELSSIALNQLLAALKIKANVFHNGQYCGMWAVDTSGSNLMNFHVVTRGTCTAWVGDQVFDLSKGDAIFMPSDAKHRLSSSQPDEVALNQSVPLAMHETAPSASTGLVCGHFEHENPIFDRLLAQLPPVIIVRSQTGVLASDIMKLILEESRRVGLSDNFLLNRLADALFYALVRDNINSESGVLAGMNHAKLSKSFELIHNNYEQKLNVERLAEVAGMSRSAFSSLFKELIELSPAEYITQWRMTQAYRWLADESISTYEAAIRCGYESEASFSKAFKRIIGIGPGQVRQLGKNK